MAFHWPTRPLLDLHHTDKNALDTRWTDTASLPTHLVNQKIRLYRSRCFHPMNSPLIVPSFFDIIRGKKRSFVRLLLARIPHVPSRGNEIVSLLLIRVFNNRSLSLIESKTMGQQLMMVCERMSEKKETSVVVRSMVIRCSQSIVSQPAYPGFSRFSRTLDSRLLLF